MISFDGSTIIAGGNNLHNIHFCDLMFLDTKTNKWVHLTRMKEARSAFSLVACNNGLYAVGGYNDQCDFILDVERLELSHDGKWIKRSVSPLPVAFKSKVRPSVVAYEGRLLVTGVTEDRHCGPVLMYTPATNKWTVLMQSAQVGVCDAFYLFREYKQLFFVSFKITEDEDNQLEYHNWQPRVHECSLVCDDTQSEITIVREVKQNDAAYKQLQTFQIGRNVYVMCNDFPIKTPHRVVDEEERICLESYRQLNQLLKTSAVHVLKASWVSHTVGS